MVNWQYIKYYSLNLFAVLLFFIASNTVYAHEYEQNGCNSMRFFNHTVENYQSITSGSIGFDFESSRCLRPDFLKNKEKNITEEDAKENIFPLQNCLKLEIAKQVADFVFSNDISEYDFSSQKSYPASSSFKHSGNEDGKGKKRKE